MNELRDALEMAGWMNGSTFDDISAHALAVSSNDEEWESIFRTMLAKTLAV